MFICIRKQSSFPADIQEDTATAATLLPRTQQVCNHNKLKTHHSKGQNPFWCSCFYIILLNNIFFIYQFQKNVNLTLTLSLFIGF